MRLFLLLVAAFGVFLAEKHKDFELPKGMPDNTVITVYLEHLFGEWWEVWPSGAVDIYFFDEDNAGNSDNIPDNVPAHLRLVKHAKYNVYSNTRFNGIWQTEIFKEQLLDQETPATGYWRVDIIKVDKYRLNVYYQGFWSEVRTFSLSLENLKSFRISSLRYVNFESVQVHIKYPNANLVPLSFDELKRFSHGEQSIHHKLATLPGFPKGGSIELIALMKSSVREAKSAANPGLIFTAVEGFPYFLKIHQEWPEMSYQARMYLSTSDSFNNAGHPTSTACSYDWWNPNGDLVHLKLTRIRYNVVEMRVLFKHHQPNEWYTNWETLCWMWIPSELTNQLDKPFNILSNDGGLLFHIDRSYPDNFPPSKATDEYFRVKKTCRCLSSCMNCDEYASGQIANCVYEPDSDCIVG